MTPEEHLGKACELLDPEPEPGERIDWLQTRIVQAQWHLAMAQAAMLSEKLAAATGDADV